MSNPLLKLVDISKYYTSKDAVTLGLRKVNVEFNKGEFVAVTGESGSGKSTLLNVLSGIDSYEEGEMFLDGQETSCFTNREWDDYRRKNIAFIFQDYSLIDSYTVLQNVELSLYDNYPDGKLRRARALELLEKVGLLSRKRHKCTKLSGGEKQRVAIARALAKDAPIILADEPTGNLDSGNSESIIKLMAETAKDKLLIMVTHNYEDVAAYATRKIRMYDGGVAEDKMIVAPPENTGGSGIKAIDEEEDKKLFKGSIRIAVNNLLATPKRSLFILSTSFIATFLIAIFLFSYINVIVPPAGLNMSGDRKDTMYVIDNDRVDLTPADLSSIVAVDGVEAALISYEAYNLSVYPKSMIWDDVDYMYSLQMNILTVANWGNAKPAYGTIPTADDEILLGWSNQGKPDLNMIGQEVELVVMGAGEYYYGDMAIEPYQNFYTVKYKISGYAPNGYCYITADALAVLSEDYIVNKIPSIEAQLISYVDSSDVENFRYEYFYSGRTKLVEDSDVTEKTIYYIYDPAAENNGFPIYQNVELTDLSPLGTLFEGGAKEVNISLYSYTNYGMSETYKVLPATSNINADIFNEYMASLPEEERIPMLIINRASNPYSVTSSKSTSLAIIAKDANSEKIIEALNTAGYKVVYPYGKPLSIIEIIMKIVRQVFGIVVGLIIVTIAVSLISEVYSRVSKAKKRDFNILRTVGLSTNIIKGINYAEFIIVNIVAFGLTFFTFVMLVIIGDVSNNATLTNAVNSLLPYGALHIQSLLIYLGVFALLMMLTLFIAKKFNKKMFRTSVKKSLTETL